MWLFLNISFISLLRFFFNPLQAYLLLICFWNSFMMAALEYFSENYKFHSILCYLFPMKLKWSQFLEDQVILLYDILTFYIT